MVIMTRLVKTTVAAAGAVLIAALLLGCTSLSGTVTHRYMAVGARSTFTYWVCVRDQGGHEDCEIVPMSIYLACGKGDQYPTCWKEDSR
ncbi:hypothetical protein [Fodinicola feengrottensis]|uniref:Lipoprotein n=1 Tax=Fodinicola feengrottensis TaxID=435914 RepID=A0ABN2JE22_9ACTN|nr:hypothetical protein [Fodinicola feengrottensis]